MALAAKYSVKTVTVTIGTDLNDQTFASLDGTAGMGSVITLVSQTATTATFLVVICYY